MLRSKRTVICPCSAAMTARLWESVMSSKILALACAVLLLVGCAKENENSNQPVQVPTIDNKGQSGSGQACLSDLSEEVSQFFDGQLNPDQVSALWDCVSADVKEFQDLTTGDGPNGSYSDLALREFLQRYFIKNGKVSDGLLSSMM